MKAQIQHTDKSRSRLILQALVPFLELKDSVLFTYRTNTNGQTGDKRSQYEASMQFYQRRVDEKRSDEIKAFIRKSILQERDGRLMATLFPTSMILALTGDSGDEGENRVDIIDDEYCEVVLRSNVFIVDGQHRMMGMIKLYEELDKMIVRTDDDDYVYDYLKDYKFNCTILVNYDLWEQGQVFVNVNFKQKPVNKSLYYEIFGAEYREDESDWKRNKIYLAHTMTRMLNEHKESPFFQRIKMLGTGAGYVSQAFVVEALMKQFSDGGLWHFNPDSPKSPGTDYFATELLSFFVAVKQLLPDYWPEPESNRGTIICKTTGVGAWIRLIGMLRKDDDLQMIALLKESAAKNSVCTEYVRRVCEQLAPLKSRAEELFGRESEFASSSGKGAETKLFKKMVYIIEHADEKTDRQVVIAGHDSDYYCEQIQEYMWVTPIDELDMLGHHYETDDISSFKVIDSKEEGNTLEIKATFNVYVTIYLDNEDDNGFSMQFPADCIAVFSKQGDGYVLTDDVSITVNTDKYYD